MKKGFLWFLLSMVFLAVFNTMFFLLGGTDHPASVWIAYGFIHFSYLMILATPLLTRKSSRAALFGASVGVISAGYFLVELIVGLLFIFGRSDSYKGSLIVQIIVLGIYAIALIPVLLANEYTADSVDRQEMEVAYIKIVSSRIKILMDKASDKTANKEIEKAYDLLHSSPTRSVATVKLLEQEIQVHVGELENAVSADNTAAIITAAGEIIAKTEERNRILRMSN